MLTMTKENPKLSVPKLVAVLNDNLIKQLVPKWLKIYLKSIGIESVSRAKNHKFLMGIRRKIELCKNAY